MQRFADDPTVAALVVRDPAGDVLYQWHRRGEPPSGHAAMAGAASPFARWSKASPAAAHTPKTLGEVRVVLLAGSRAGAQAPASPRVMRTAGRADLQQGSAAGRRASPGSAASIGAAFGWRAGRKLEKPIVALIRSAERIGQGDYTRPLDVVRRDELGELQQALERMRAKLRQTTINKNYLHNVLNSMTDAVFVTSPDGVIKVANSAACKMLGYARGGDPRPQHHLGAR